VLKLSYGETAVLLEGDAEKRIEQLMSASGEARAGLLKVGHHGSATSSTAKFLSAVRPHYAVISAGARNPFGYPRPEVAGTPWRPWASPLSARTRTAR